MPDFSKPEHEMFTGRRPRAFQFKCCVGTAILGQPPVRRKTFGEESVLSVQWFDSVISFTPGFSPVVNVDDDLRTVLTVCALETVKTVSKLGEQVLTGLKPGENETSAWAAREIYSPVVLKSGKSKLWLSLFVDWERLPVRL